MSLVWAEERSLPIAISESVMSNQFFDKPILNSPYVVPTKHWELDKEGQYAVATSETASCMSKLSVHASLQKYDRRFQAMCLPRPAEANPRLRLGTNATRYNP